MVIVDDVALLRRRILEPLGLRDRRQGQHGKDA
jgi:hypothetical protein